MSASASWYFFCIFFIRASASWYFFFLVPALSGIYFIYLFVYSGRCGENGALEKMGFYLFIYCLFVCLLRSLWREWASRSST
jgi:hypothetical protein